MDYTFAPLYVRILFFLLLGIAGAVVMFLLTKTCRKPIRWLAGTMAFFVFLAASCSTVYSLTHPTVKTSICTFLKEERSAQLNPFSMDCVFLTGDTEMRIELDALTKNNVISGSPKLESGTVYVVTYETRENLILGIQER